MITEERNKQLNNAGFSLVELLVAVIVLAIVVIPIMNSFLTSMKTNAKAERTMDATAIAENIMEQFEAHTIEAMKEKYETEGYIIEKTPETDVDGKWVFVVEDDSTTGKDYQVEITLDPTAYASVNNEPLADIQNLMGSMNAVFSEKKDAEKEAVEHFKSAGYDGNTIAKSVERIINVDITKSIISVDLGGGETQAVETYMVTAQSHYKCDPTLLFSGEYNQYPISSDVYTIFSNKQAVIEKAAEIKEKKAAGLTLGEDDVIESQLANVVINLRPRSTGGKDIITVNNTDNVGFNLYLVKQGTAAIQNGYNVECTIVEECKSDWNHAGNLATTKAACQLRTNFYTGTGLESYVTIRYEDAKLSGWVSGADAINVLQTTDLTPEYAYDRIYDMIVKVYEDGARGIENPLVTMTGTVTN